jgi:tellurite resistance protein TerC
MNRNSVTVGDRVGVAVNRNKIVMTYRTARRVVITVVGGTVLVIGLCLLVLPGPAIIVIPLGLAILGLEYAWARRFLDRVRELSRKTTKRNGS